ncbi:hypothetical protein [Clostridium sp.]|uniref:hypothetical protein n=1 Tax=Clostridium sp. TaxID=1506 RepID=UPI0035A0B9F3
MENNIRKFLKKNPTQTISEVIKNSGIGRTSFYEIMNGSQVPKITTAKKISKAIGLPVTDVFPLLKE